MVWVYTGKPSAKGTCKMGKAIYFKATTVPKFFLPYRLI